MNSLVVFAAIIAAAMARPGADQVVSVSQDTLGNYNLKYAIEGISRVENRDIHGNVNGGFSYVDPHGILRKTEFTSGVHGYQAIGTDIPLPVPDTPEVAIAKAEHLSVLRAAELAPKIPEFQEGGELVEIVEVPLVKSAPFAVQVAPAVHATPIHSFGHLGIPETPEVAIARAEHLAAHAAARANLLVH